MVHINKNSLRCSIVSKSAQWDPKMWGTATLRYKSRSETTGSQSILSSASPDTAQLFPAMVIPIYTPTNSSLYILTISPLSVIWVLNTFPSLFFPIFLMNRSSSRVAKFISLFHHSQYFMSHSWNLSIFLTLYSPILPNVLSLCFLPVRSMALQAYQLLRVSVGFCLQ